MSYGLFGWSGTTGLQLLVHAVRGVGGRPHGRIFQVVLGQEGHELADQRQALLLALRGEVRDAGRRPVHRRAAQLLEGDLLVRDRLDDVGARHEHVGGVLDHEDEVGDGGRVDGAARARPHHGGDLRHDARGQRVAQENVGVARERHHALLDPRAAGIVQPDHGHARLHGEVHDLADLARVRLGERAAEDREVLCEGEDGAAVDAPRARHHAVTRDALGVHAEVVVLVDHEAIHLRERPLVEEDFESLAGRFLPRLVLALDPLRPARRVGGVVAAVEFLEAILEGHGCGSLEWPTLASARRCAPVCREV